MRQPTLTSAQREDLALAQKAALRPQDPYDPAANISARSLYALLAMPGATDPGHGILENAMSGLLVCALADTPGMAEDLFAEVPGQKWWYTKGVDLAATAPNVDKLMMDDVRAASTIIEVKFDAQFNDMADEPGQLARYANVSPSARGFVVMPAWRAHTKGPTQVRDSAEANEKEWTIVTWESIRTWLGEHLGEHAPTDLTDPVFCVMATMARIRD